MVFSASGCQWTKLMVLIFFVSGWLQGCQTVPEVEKASNDDSSDITHLTLEAGEVIRHSEPLPWQTDFFVVWHYRSGTTERKLAFRAWDFNKDGRFELVDRLDSFGNVVSFGIDLLSDGSHHLIINNYKN